MDKNPANQQTTPPKPTNLLIWVIFIIVVLAVAGGIWYVVSQDNDNTDTVNNRTNSEVTNSTSGWKTFEDDAGGFSIRYPEQWIADRDNLPFPNAAVAINNADIVNSCGCSVYVTIEDNPNQLSINDWLNSESPKKDSYISLQEYLAEKNHANGTVKQFAGNYEEQPIIISGVKGLQQVRNAEGGGYKRVIIPSGTKIYVITAWSDAYYFSDKNKQTDSGELARTAGSIIKSFTLRNEARLVVDPTSGSYIFTDADFRITIPGTWYTTEPTDQGGNASILMTASAENVSDVLGLQSGGTGVVLHVIRDTSVQSVDEYTNENVVRTGTLISDTNILVGDAHGIRREVDATNVESLEGSYSVEYVIQSENGIIRLLFLSLTKQGISIHAETINTILSSVRVA